MKIVIFGLTVSSSWGNGHATLWRGLLGALGRRGHEVAFYERDVAYYRENRDLDELPGGGRLVLYGEWPEVRARARVDLADADVAIVTSYCPDALAAEALLEDSGVPVRAFYDLDAPVTLDRTRRGERVAYVGPRGYAGYDLVLSYTGGRALDALRAELGARRVAPLYGSVDPSVHRPARPLERYRADLSYLGTYADDRQAALERLFLEPARRLPARRFSIGGACYPEAFPWGPNVWFVRHLPPAEHAAFFASSRLTVNVTRRAMADMGWCPSGRLFEAAASGVPILSDAWEGLDAFFAPGREILIARTAEEAAAAVELPDRELRGVALAARERALEEHTADARAFQLERVLEGLEAAAGSA